MLNYFVKKAIRFISGPNGNLFGDRSSCYGTDNGHSAPGMFATTSKWTKLFTQVVDELRPSFLDVAEVQLGQGSKKTLVKNVEILQQIEKGEGIVANWAFGDERYKSYTPAHEAQRGYEMVALRVTEYRSCLIEYAQWRNQEAGVVVDTVTLRIKD